jgi:casein kinase II subunit beta
LFSQSELSIPCSMNADIWVDRFLQRSSSIYFVRVPHSFISELLGSTRFTDSVPQFEVARGLILDPEFRLDSSLDVNVIQSQAEILYGLIHAEFLATPDGCTQLMQKRSQSTYGHCPRLFCRRTLCIPCGKREVKAAPAKRFCPTCRHIYRFDDSIFSSIDGAYFGMDYIDIMLSLHPEIALAEPSPEYIPRIYGFRISPAAEAIETEDDIPRWLVEFSSFIHEVLFVIL